jgi:putative addiction module CopG family antidote
MSKSYTPGAEADAIIARQIAKGYFTTPDEVVRAALQMLEEHEAGLADLRAKIDEADAAYERGEYTAYASAEDLLVDIQRLEDELSRQKN